MKRYSLGNDELVSPSLHRPLPVQILSPFTGDPLSPSDPGILTSFTGWGRGWKRIVAIEIVRTYTIGVLYILCILLTSGELFTAFTFCYEVFQAKGDFQLQMEEDEMRLVKRETA